MIDYVENTIGITEVKFSKLSNEDKIKLLEKHGNIGIFQKLSINELEKRVKFSKVYNNNNNKIQIIYGDIANIQISVDDKFVNTFQIASNFNCLENADVVDNNLVTGYYYDVTQGPAASFGPMIGVLYRTYCCGTHNLLEDLNVKVLNGKCYINKNMLVDRNKIKIGLHQNIDVLYNRNGKITKPVKINQILCSTLNLNISGTIHQTQEFLYAAYMGTYLAAILSKTDNLYLTLIGGDSFRNSINDIINYIKLSHEKYGKYIKNVYLVMYKPNDEITKHFK